MLKSRGMKILQDEGSNRVHDAFGRSSRARTHTWAHPRLHTRGRSRALHRSFPTHVYTGSLSPPRIVVC